MPVARRAKLEGTLIFMVLIALAMAARDASAGTLDLIQRDGSIRIAYREDARPFSYRNADDKPAGYMVDLCRAVATKLSQQLEGSPLKVVYVPVTAANRFETVQQGNADLLCEATSATLARRKLVDFSIATYVGGTSLMIRADGPRNLEGFAGRKIGVLGGTTTEEALRNALKKAGVSAEVHATKTHTEGLALLDDGATSAYFAERDILTSLLRDSKAPEKLMVAENYLTIEPYALALPLGDHEFRLAVDRALSHIYLSGEIGTIFQQTFSSKAKPSQLLKTLFVISALPD
jgi:polar amino acid transport system substrate-binding protein/glutamate/aspartate transport system substrate-binding protein